MSTTLSNGTVTLTPSAVYDYESTRAARTIVHDILGTSTPAIDLYPSKLRTGTLKCAMSTRALATQMEALAASGTVIVMADSAVPDVNMTFVVSGDITTTSDVGVWTVSFDYQAVS